MKYFPSFLQPSEWPLSTLGHRTQCASLAVPSVSAQKAKEMEQNLAGNAPHPHRNPAGRRSDAIQLLVVVFDMSEGRMVVDLRTDRSSELTIFRRVDAQTSGCSGYNGTLSEFLQAVTIDERGRFAATLYNLQPSDFLSVIATAPNQGNSEPALNAKVKSSFYKGIISDAQQYNSTPITRFIQARK